MSAEDDRDAVAGDLAPGAVLAAARANEKLSIAEVARHLKLSVVQVEALESGDFDRFPGPVFVRGFFRNYARLLKLDPDALLRRVEPELSPLPLLPETPPSKDIPFPPPPPRRWPLFAALGLVVVGVLVVHEFYWTDPLPAPPEPAPVAPPAPAAVPPAPVAAPPVKDDSVTVSQATIDGSVNQSDPAPQGPPAGSGEALSSTAAAIVDAPRAPAPASAVVAAAGAGVLQMRFEDESWIEVRDGSGAIIFSQLNPPGTEKRVRGDPPLTLIIGNAHGVRLTYNDRPVDLKPHTKVDVARLVLE